MPQNHPIYQTSSYEKALHKFRHYLASAQAGPTPVYEIRSFAINNLTGLKQAISQLPKGSAIWQHTDKWHTAAFYLEAGKAHRFSRQVMNLFANGVNNETNFRILWEQYNGNTEWGAFPVIKTRDYAQTARKKQASYIVAILDSENTSSQIPGGFGVNTVHRTHLISSQMTGIEAHKGLLIDYDGWLNSVPLRLFEDDIINKSETQDIIWCANVWIGQQDHGLHFRYDMYDKDYREVASQEWVDDRWTYIWHFDPGQDSLTKH